VWNKSHHAYKSLSAARAPPVGEIVSRWCGQLGNRRIELNYGPGLWTYGHRHPSDIIIQRVLVWVLEQLVAASSLDVSFASAASYLTWCVKTDSLRLINRSFCDPLPCIQT